MRRAVTSSGLVAYARKSVNTVMASLGFSSR
jgi:hypothetical protein